MVVVVLVRLLVVVVVVHIHANGWSVSSSGTAGGGGGESAEQISQTHRRSCPATKESRVLALAERERQYASASASASEDFHSIAGRPLGRREREQCSNRADTVAGVQLLLLYISVSVVE